MSSGVDSELHGSSRERDPANPSGENPELLKLPSAANSRNLKLPGQFTEFAVRYGISLVFVGLVAALMIISPTFRRPENLWNILQQNSTIGVVSCGMLLMMIVGGFHPGRHRRRYDCRGLLPPGIHQRGICLLLDDGAEGQSKAATILYAEPGDH